MYLDNDVEVRTYNCIPSWDRVIQHLVTTHYNCISSNVCFFKKTQILNCGVLILQYGKHNEREGNANMETS